MRRRRARWASLGVAGAFAVSAGVFGALAWDARQDFQATLLERPAAEANDEYTRDLTLSLTSLGVSAVATALGLYVFRDRD